jgi:acyl carrier protein
MISIETFIEELESSLVMVDPNTLRPDTRFREEAWWDSLAVLGILAVFDGCFARQIQPPALRDCETVEDLYNLGVKLSS